MKKVVLLSSFCFMLSLPSCSSNHDDSGPRCGNNVIDFSLMEECDGEVFSSCQSLFDQGFIGGMLKCGDDCMFDTTDCILPTCGDGAIEGFEECDTTNLSGKTCQDIGFFTGGTLACDPATCQFDSSGCTQPTCSYTDIPVNTAGSDGGIQINFDICLGTQIYDLPQDNDCLGIQTPGHEKVFRILLPEGSTGVYFQLRNAIGSPIDVAMYTMPTCLGLYECIDGSYSYSNGFIHLIVTKSRYESKELFLVIDSYGLHDCSGEPLYVNFFSEVYYN